METLLVIIFVFIMKLLTYFLPEVLTILMLVVIAGFFLSLKTSGKKNEESKSPKQETAKSSYMQFGQFMEEDDKRQGGGLL